MAVRAMKKKSYYRWAAALVAASLTLSGCGGGDDKPEDPPKDGGKAPAGETGKPEPKDPDPAPKDPDPAPKEADPAPKDPEPAPKDPEPAPKDPDPAPVDPEPAPADPEPAGAATTDGGAVGKAINGAWAPDKDSLMAMMKKEAAAQAGVEELPAEAMAMMTMMLEVMADKMVIELNDGKANLYSPDGVEAETYEFVSADEATGEFVVKMVDADGEAEEGKGKVDGDTMTMTSEGVTMSMKRLSDEEFAARKKAIEEFDPSALLQGLAPGGGEVPAGGGEGSDPAPAPIPGVE